MENILPLAQIVNYRCSTKIIVNHFGNPQGMYGLLIFQPMEIISLEAITITSVYLIRIAIFLFGITQLSMLIQFQFQPMENTLQEVLNVMIVVLIVRFIFLI